MSDVVGQATEQIKGVLTTYFVGTDLEDDLDVASNEVLKSIQHLLQTTPVGKGKLGATIMTESASMRGGKNGLPGIPPRSI